jgi:hypothetical protein
MESFVSSKPTARYWKVHCSALQPASLHTASSRHPSSDSTLWCRSAGVTHMVPPHGTHVPPTRMPRGAWWPPVREATSTGDGKFTYGRRGG